MAHIICDMCKGKKTLWLSGSDYLECPQCDATGTVEVIAQHVNAKVRKIFIPGLPSFETVELPKRSLIADTEIKRF